MSFVPDEEIDTGLGMGLLSQSQEFKAWNIAVAIDEGLASVDGNMMIYYGERHCFWLDVSVYSAENY